MARKLLTATAMVEPMSKDQQHAIDIQTKTGTLQPGGSVSMYGGSTQHF